jgi:hypothetical protein
VKSDLGIYNFVERFDSNHNGEIVQTQTTFVEVVSDLDAQSPAPHSKIRIHFRGKRELSLKKGKFSSMQISDNHPLLIDHIDPIASVHLASGIADKEKFGDELETVVKDIFGGWRSLEDYLNMPLNIFFEKDFGILMFAPITYAEAAIEMAEAMGVKLTIRGLRKQEGNPRVIFFDEHYIIAEDFRVQYLS